MNKTLHIIQTLAKIGKIISTIILVCCIVGSIGCIIGIVSLSAIPEAIRVGGVTIHSMIEKRADLSMGTLYTTMAVGIILCTGEAIVCKLAQRYFRHELADGHPFVYETATELMRLGMWVILVPFITIILADVCYNTMSRFFTDIADMHMNDFASYGLGAALILMGLICRYGAQRIAEKQEAAEL